MLEWAAPTPVFPDVLGRGCAVPPSCAQSLPRRVCGKARGWAEAGHTAPCNFSLRPLGGSAGAGQRGRMGRPRSGREFAETCLSAPEGEPSKITNRKEETHSCSVAWCHMGASDAGRWPPTWICPSAGAEGGQAPAALSPTRTVVTRSWHVAASSRASHRLCAEGDRQVRGEAGSQRWGDREGERRGDRETGRQMERERWRDREIGRQR